MRSDVSRTREQSQINLIIHADDIGMCHSANKTSIEAYEKGVVSSGSLMVLCPWFMEAAAYFRNHPEFDVGVHVTLTSEWQFYKWSPVAPKEKVPGLVGKDGFMYRTSDEVVEHTSGREVETEIRAQIERALEFGIKPTHLDTHMGTVHYKPEYLDAYVGLAEEFGIPVLLHEVTPELKQRLLHLVPIMPQYVGFSGQGSFNDRKIGSLRMLENLKPGVYETILHLSGDDEEIKAIIGPDAHLRHEEYLIFSDPEIRQVMKKREIRLIGWRDLKQLATLK
jgi:hypothetical protein